MRIYYPLLTNLLNPIGGMRKTKVFRASEQGAGHPDLGLYAAPRSSVDGRGLDNVFCGRLWRSLKYENIYLNQYATVRQLPTGLNAYFDFYNHERPHQNLNYRTPTEEHFVL